MIKMNEKLSALFIGILWFQNCGMHFRSSEDENSRTRIGFNTFVEEATRWGSRIAWNPKIIHCMFVPFKDTLVGIWKRLSWWVTSIFHTNAWVNETGAGVHETAVGIISSGRSWRSHRRQRIQFNDSLQLGSQVCFRCPKRWKFRMQNQHWTRNGRSSKRFQHGSWTKLNAERRFFWKHKETKRKPSLPHWWTSVISKNAELEPKFQKCKGRVVLRGDSVKDVSGPTQSLLNKAHLRHKWRQQNQWMPWQGYQDVQDKQPTQCQHTLR